MEHQRVIWLPQDPFGFVREFELGLDSRSILHSTEGAEMNNKGRVDVTMAPPDEDVRRALNQMRGRFSTANEGDMRAVGSLRAETSKNAEA